MSKKAALHNLGCKVNAYETEAMQEMLEKAGYEIVPFKEGADVYVINTCTVTNIADRKSRQMLHRARKMNPDAVVVAAGCYVQAQEGKVDSCIDIVLGNNKKKDLIRILDEYRKSRAESGREKEILPDVELEDIGHTKEYESLNLTRPGDHTRAYIKVQDGCNQFCTYCIIPYARGRVRSRRQSDVVEEVKRLAEAGYQEVVLTGIHLSSYGLDFPEGEKETLLDLIRAVDAVDGIRRIRLGSLEPGIITEEFAEAIAAMPKVCPHFHLSLQSGSNGTLKRMNRKYTAEEYKHKCDLLRKVYGNPALTTDVIVGFPQESEEEFEESRAFVEDIHFFETHIFKYSRREGTRAAAMAGQIPEQEKTKRSHVLLELDERRRQEYMEGFLGKELEVLMEEEVEIDGIRYWTGHTREYLRVAVLSEENLMNQMVLVTPARIHGKDCLM